MFSYRRCRQLELLLLSNRRNIGDTTTHVPRFVLSSCLFTKSFSSTNGIVVEAREKEQKQSFAESYFINSCGLSLEAAKCVSKRIKFDFPEKPDLVLDFLRNRGFTDTQIRKVVKSCPQVLVANIEGNLLPKLEFLRSIGCSTADSAKIVSSTPILLACSLDNRIIPGYKFLKDLVAHDRILKALRRSARILLQDVEEGMASKVSILRGFGVPQFNINKLLEISPNSFVQSITKFDEKIKKVISLGFDPSEKRFARAFAVVSEMQKSTWEHKVEVYKQCGWSEDDIQSAFLKQPVCMSLSEKNIMSTMDFLVNKMGWQAADVARNPTALTYSLEGRIIPRCSVITVLLQKGLIKEGRPLSPVIVSTHQYFIDTFVTKYQDQVPELLDIFQGKMDLSQFSLKIGGKTGAKQL